MNEQKRALKKIIEEHIYFETGKRMGGFSVSGVLNFTEYLRGLEKEYIQKYGEIELPTTLAGLRAAAHSLAA